MDLSIIIVNYCTYDLTKQTIESVIGKDHPFDYDIYVVDNASYDDSPQKLKRNFSKEIDNGLLKFIECSKNKGFSFANNLAITQSTAKYKLLLNSDTIVLGDCLNKCINHMEKDDNIGALGCKVVLPDGNLDKACKRSFPDISTSFYRISGLSYLFPKNKRFTRYNLTDLDENEIHDVDCLTGAFMLVRSKTIDQVGLLDEKFFMYGEDIDWCYRIKSAGWKIIYYGKAEITHYKGTNKKQRNKLIYEFHRSMHIFYNKYYRDQNHLPLSALIYIGIWSKFGLKLFLNLFKKQT